MRARNTNGIVKFGFLHALMYRSYTERSQLRRKGEAMNVIATDLNVIRSKPIASLGAA